MIAGSFARSLRRWNACAFLVVFLPLAGRAQYRGGYMDDLDSGDYQWTVDPAFQEDVFTFARLKHESGGGFGYFSRRMGWAEDAPRADVMLAFRVHQITSMNVRPGFNPVDFTKEELGKHPFVYFSGVESMALRSEEISVLRNYLLSGGWRSGFVPSHLVPFSYCWGRRNCMNGERMMVEQVEMVSFTWKSIVSI